MPIEINGWKIALDVLVAPPGTIKYTALLGRDVEVSIKPPAQEILPVQTRAQRQRAELTEQQEQTETEESGADPVTVDDLPEIEQDLPEEAIITIPELEQDPPEVTVDNLPELEQDLPEVTVDNLPELEQDLPEVTVDNLPELEQDLPE